MAEQLDGGSGPRSLVHSLYEELTCPVCLEIFEDPRVLPCLHSYCMKCIERLAFTKNTQAKTLKCPKCTVEHPIPPQGPSGFPKNFMLISLLDVLNTHQTAGSCEGSLNPSQISSSRLSSSSNSEHGTLGTEPLVLNACSIHGVTMEMFCVDCETLICKECLRDKGMNSEHKAHMIDEVHKLKKTFRQTIKPLLTSVETQLVKLTKEMSEMNKKDAMTVLSCKSDINEYYDQQEENLENRIAKLKEKLQAVKTHRELLLQKVERIAANHEKNRTVDRDLVTRHTEKMTEAITNAKDLLHSENDTKLLCDYKKTVEGLNSVLANKIDPSCMHQPPKISFSKANEPTECEVVNPKAVVVEGLQSAKSGANTFTLTLTTPPINKPRLTVNVTLPNGRRAEADTIHFEPKGKYTWSISFYVPPTSFPLAGFLRTGVSKVVVRVMLFDVEIEGSPFEVPCEKLIGRNLVMEKVLNT